MNDPNKRQEEKNDETRELFLSEPQGDLLTEAMMEIDDNEEEDGPDDAPRPGNEQR